MRSFTSIAAASIITVLHVVLIQPRETMSLMVPGNPVYPGGLTPPGPYPQFPLPTPSDRAPNLQRLPLVLLFINIENLKILLPILLHAEQRYPEQSPLYSPTDEYWWENHKPKPPSDFDPPGQPEFSPPPFY